MSKALKDASFSETDVALPNGAASTYSSDIDLGFALGTGHERPNLELIITVPDLTVTHLPDTRTLTLAVAAGASANPTTLIADSIEVFTGAGGAGASGTTTRFTLPTDCPRYVRVKFTGGTSAGDMSAVDAEVSMVF